MFLQLFPLLLSSGTALADVDYFWQVTDFHLDQHYGTAGPLGDFDYVGYYDYATCWNTTNTAKFGAHTCDSPLALVTSAADFMASYNPSDGGKVRFVLWTGDDTVHCDDAYSDKNTVIEIISTLSQQLNKTGLPVLPVQGNHDVYLADQFPGVGDEEGWVEVYQDTSTAWQENMITSTEAMNQFVENYGAYKVKLQVEDWQSPWWLIGLNTNLDYHSDHLSEGREDPGSQLAFLLEALLMVREEGGKAIVAAHVAPGIKSRQDPGRPELGSFYPELNSAFLDIVQQFTDVIEIQLYGHEHSDGLRLIPGPSLALMAPAVTPWDSSTPTDPRNPGLRLFQFEQDTGRILNFEQFFLNLTQANEKGEAEWQLEYDFLGYYGLENMELSSVAGLVAAMEQGGLPLEKYLQAGSGMANPSYQCGDACKRQHYCGMAFARYPDYATCIEKT